MLAYNLLLLAVISLALAKHLSYYKDEGESMATIKKFGLPNL